MFYDADGPRAVGEFIGDPLQRQIDNVAKDDGTSTHTEIFASLCELHGIHGPNSDLLKHPSLYPNYSVSSPEDDLVFTSDFGPMRIEDFIRIAWNRGIKPENFGYDHEHPNPAYFNGFQAYKNHAPLNDGRWHSGANYCGSDFALGTDLLIGHSKWSPRFLVGTVYIDDKVLAEHGMERPTPEFWLSEDGQKAIEESITDTDINLRVVEGLTSKALLLGKDTLLQDSVPSGTTGYQYSMSLPRKDKSRRLPDGRVVILGREALVH